MPRYSYKCKSCGQAYELTHGFDETPHERCFNDGELLVKVITAPAVKFVGTGWGSGDRFDVDGD